MPLFYVSGLKGVISILLNCLGVRRTGITPGPYGHVDVVPQLQTLSDLSLSKPTLTPKPALTQTKACCTAHLKSGNCDGRCV